MKHYPAPVTTSDSVCVECGEESKGRYRCRACLYILCKEWKHKLRANEAITHADITDIFEFYNKDD